MHKTLLTLLIFTSFAPMIWAQSKQDTILSNYSAYKRSLSFAGLLQTRYTLSTTPNVDVNGRNFPDTINGVKNSFSLKRVRLQTKAVINDHFDAAILVNFADFSNANVAGRVLENAFIRYSLNRHFHVIAGQYRPFFGIEDAIPVDLIKSLDYSNQYTAFGASGWQSFQMGIGIYGDLNDNADIPLRYYVGAHNGNNKNQLSDNDNSKHVYTRLEADLAEKVTVGINGALGSTMGADGSAWGGDIRSKIKINEKWLLELIGEYKNGSNFSAWNASRVPRPSMSQFRMQGFYILPNLRFEYNHPRVRAIEFSARYEYFNEHYKLNSNPRQTIIPMLSLVFADNYFVCLQLGMTLDFYKKDVPLSTQYSHNAAVAQLQIRF